MPIVVDRNLEFVHPANVQALAYWQSKCGPRAMPARADLDPLEMRGFLANVALVDVLPREGRPSEFRIRLAGAAIEDVFGPVSARLLTDAVPAATAARWAGMFQATIDARGPIRVSGRVSYEKMDYLETEALFAPLADAGADISMLFASAAFWSETEKP